MPCKNPNMISLDMNSVVVYTHPDNKFFRAAKYEIDNIDREQTNHAWEQIESLRFSVANILEDMRSPLIYDEYALQRIMNTAHEMGMTQKELEYTYRDLVEDEGERHVIEFSETDDDDAWPVPDETTPENKHSVMVSCFQEEISKLVKEMCERFYENLNAEVNSAKEI